MPDSIIDTIHAAASTWRKLGSSEMSACAEFVESVIESGDGTVEEQVDVLVSAMDELVQAAQHARNQVRTIARRHGAFRVIAVYEDNLQTFDTTVRAASGEEAGRAAAAEATAPIRIVTVLCDDGSVAA